MKSLTYLGIILLIQSIGLSESLFEGCDHTYNLKGGSTAYLLSPRFPAIYPVGTSCRYKFIAPLDYEILAECSINIYKSPSACTTEFFYISRDGDSTLTGAEQFCGSGNITRTTLFRELVIAYISGSSRNSDGGKFNCTLITRPQACDCGWSQNTRIVGGIEASKGEYPSMVAIYHKPSGAVICGGVIASHREVLTAAHCTNIYSVASDLQVIVGDHNLTSSTESPYAATYNVSSIIQNTGYNPTNNEDDISILVISSNIQWSRGVGPICLPMDQLNNTFDYTEVNVVGWGTTSFAGPKSDTLQTAAVNVLPNSVCEYVYPMLVSSQICTYYDGRDACQFDSGGPVVYKGPIRQSLIGIISYGDGCGNNPGVNTRMTSFIDWVKNNTVGTLCAKPFN